MVESKEKKVFMVYSAEHIVSPLQKNILEEPNAESHMT
jgi:hypothetical protein